MSTRNASLGVPLAPLVTHVTLYIHTIAPGSPTRCVDVLRATWKSKSKGDIRPGMSPLCFPDERCAFAALPKCRSLAKRERWVDHSPRQTQPVVAFSLREGHEKRRGKPSRRDAPRSRRGKCDTRCRGQVKTSDTCRCVRKTGSVLHVAWATFAKLY